jgi:hypothetical protein
MSREGPEVLQLRRPPQEVRRLQSGPELMADWLAPLAFLVLLSLATSETP